MREGEVDRGRVERAEGLEGSPGKEAYLVRAARDEFEKMMEQLKQVLQDKEKEIRDDKD